MRKDKGMRSDNDKAHTDINEEISKTLALLDGSNASVISLLTGLSRAEIDALGGVEENSGKLE